MKKIGITGGIASGKSIISRIIEEIGYPVFYSDLVSRQLVNSSISLKKSITSLLGSKAYIGEKIDHVFVAKIVFSNPELLEQLNRIIHPEVRKAFSDWCLNQHSKVVFNEAAILFETGAYRNFDATILVTAPAEIRIERVMLRDQSTHEDILKRMKRQLSDEEKIPLASFVLINDDKTPVIRQVEQMISSICCD